MTEVTLGLLMTIGALSSPYAKTHMLVPELGLRHELSETFFVVGRLSARARPEALTRFNPVTGLCDVAVGARWGDASVSVGHRSEHAAGRNAGLERLAESYDYVRLEVRL